MIDRNELVEQILRQAADPVSTTRAWIKFKRPYTIGTIEHQAPNGTEYVGLALAKVCWPDTWDKKRGAHIVLLRAAREIADDIINKQNGQMLQAVDTIIEGVLKDVLAGGVGEEI